MTNQSPLGKAITFTRFDVNKAHYIRIQYDVRVRIKCKNRDEINTGKR